MRSLSRSALLSLFLLCLLLAMGTVAESGEQPPRPAKIDNWVAQQMTNALPVSLMTSFYCLIGEAETDLFVVNVFAEPLEAEVVAFNFEGDSHSLGTFAEPGGVRGGRYPGQFRRHRRSAPGPGFLGGRHL